MGISSDKTSEISESDIEDYSETPYLQLQSGKYKVKVNGVLRCPFCPNKKKQDYKYKELLAHASGVSKGSSRKKARVKANHLALAKYLENEPAGDVEPVPYPPVLPLNDSEAEPDEIYVFPVMGIVINPLKKTDDKEVLLQSGYWLKRLSRFKPVKVNAFWVEEDSIVGVIGNFNDDLSGFASVTEFEKAFENECCIKKEWTEKRGDSESKAYGWCARAEDFYSEGPIGEYLSKEGKLSTVSEISKEKAQGQNRVLDNILSSIHMNNEDLSKVQDSYEKKAMSSQMALDAKKNLQKLLKTVFYLDTKMLMIHIAFGRLSHYCFYFIFSGRKKMHQKLLLNIERIIAEKEAQRKDLCTEMEKLDAWSKQLDEMEAKYIDKAENKILFMVSIDT